MWDGQIDAKGGVCWWGAQIEVLKGSTTPEGTPALWLASTWQHLSCSNSALHRKPSQAGTESVIRNLFHIDWFPCQWMQQFSVEFVFSVFVFFKFLFNFFFTVMPVFWLLDCLDFFGVRLVVFYSVIWLYYPLFALIFIINFYLFVLKLWENCLLKK